MLNIMKEELMLNLFTSARRLSLAASAMLLCFAAMPASAQDRYTISADGQEVTDNNSHLTWRRCAEGTRWLGNACVGKPTLLSYKDAKAWAMSEGKAGGWRLPTELELLTLVDKTKKKKPKTDVMAFPNTPNMPFWCLPPGAADELNGRMVNFGNGKVEPGLGERKVPVRLVKGQ